MQTLFTECTVTGRAARAETRTAMFFLDPFIWRWFPDISVGKNPTGADSQRGSRLLLFPSLRTFLQLPCRTASPRVRSWGSVRRVVFEQKGTEETEERDVLRRIGSLEEKRAEKGR
jgi:hypothetical protein